MGNAVTYIRPALVNKSFTYHDKSNDPFQPIDLIEEGEDFGKPIDEALNGFYRAIDALWSAMFDAKGTLEIHLESMKGPTNYGWIGDKSIAILLLAMCLGGYKSKVSFRTYREALEAMLNILVGIFNILPEDQRPKILKELEISNGGAVDFGYLPESRAEYRLTALALKMMGDYRWHCIRDSVNTDFDCYGKAVVCVDDKDEFDKLTVGTDNTCIACGGEKKDVKYFLQLNKYSILCDECVGKAHEMMQTGNNVEIIHNKIKSEMQMQREAVERVFG